MAEDSIWKTSKYVFKKILASRKSLLFVFLFALTTGFLLLGVGGATFAEWSEFIMWLFGFYVAGNVAQDFSSSGGADETHTSGDHE